MKKLIGALSLVTLALAACKDSTEPSLGLPAKLIIQAGGGAPQTGVIGQAVLTAPTVLVTDASNRPVPGVAVTFAITSGGGSLSSTTQTTSSTGVGSVVWTLGNTFGPKTLTATVAGLPPVTFSAVAIAPDAGVLAFNLVDPAGDTLAPPTTTLPPAIDLLSLRGDFKRDSLILTATFSGPVTFGSAAPNAVTGFIEFDIDDNASTGVPSLSNNFGASAAVGGEYLLTFSGSTGTSFTLASQTSSSPVQASFSGSTVVVRVPMSLLGNDDGNFTIVGVIGTIDRPTDIFPNSGQTTVRRGIGVSSTMNVVSDRLQGPTPAHTTVSWKSLVNFLKLPLPVEGSPPRPALYSPARR
jgi:hypothetical protein